MLVYAKTSKYGGDWYTATNKAGDSIVCVFQNTAYEKVTNYKTANGNPRCFNITKIKGNKKSKQVERDGELYDNVKYYITDCEVSEPPVIDLDE